MDGCDHSNFGPPAADPEQSVDGGRLSPAAALAGVPCGICHDDTAFDEPSNREGDGKSRRTAPWPFLIRRLG
jgi:hypothetical protein